MLGGRDPTCQGHHAEHRGGQHETCPRRRCWVVGHKWGVLCVGPRPRRAAVCRRRGLCRREAQECRLGTGRPVPGTVMTFTERLPCARQGDGLWGPRAVQSPRQLAGGSRRLPLTGDRATCPRWQPTWRAGVGFQSRVPRSGRAHSPSRLSCPQITGPWRSLWIRFGYDPRKHPEAKIYQVLDFRIRCGMKYGKVTNTSLSPSVLSPALTLAVSTRPHGEGERPPPR